MTPLGDYPTPVERLKVTTAKGSRVWIKRDDLTSNVYGGNKVRKLELIFDEALQQGRRRVLTFGAAGSHHVLATARLAPLYQLCTAAIITPQPRTLHAEETLQAIVSEPIELYPCRNYAHLPLTLAKAYHPGEDMLVRPGASSALGALGYSKAVDELAFQVQQGDIPRPDAIVVAVGSGGTAAGLVAGVTRLGWHTKVVGVLVVPYPIMNRMSVISLAWRVSKLDGGTCSFANLSNHLILNTDFVGPGYGHPTSAGHSATQDAARLGITLDPTYTAKAFAALQRYAVDGSFRDLLFWHTLAAPLPTAANISSGRKPLFFRMLKLLT